MCHPEVPPGTTLPDVRTQEVTVRLRDGSAMPGLLALPSATPAPAVLVIPDVYGRSPFYESLAARIARAGFVALDVEYFFREGRVALDDRPAAQARAAKLDQRRTLGDLDAALAWLTERGDVRGGRMGVIGFCMGGTLALDLAAARGDVAPVSYYGFPARPRSNVPTPLEVAAQMSGPIQGHWGTADEGVGIENVRELSRRLAAAGVEHEFHYYEGLGHGFMRSMLDDEDAAAHEQACESWKRTLDFWREHLGEELSGTHRWHDPNVRHQRRAAHHTAHRPRDRRDGAAH